VESKGEGKLTMIQQLLLTRLTRKLGDKIKEKGKYLTHDTPRLRFRNVE
jgi:hypothetical protein